MDRGIGLLSTRRSALVTLAAAATAVGANIQPSVDDLEDEKIAAKIADGRTKTRAALNAATAKYGMAPRELGLAQFAGKLAMGLSCTIQVVGDSTGNDTVEWVRKLAWHLHDTTPESTRIEYDVWAGATQSYNTSVMREGDYPAPFEGVVIRDTFTRTGALVGSMPDVGSSAWTTGNAWTTEGSAAVPGTSGGMAAVIKTGAAGELTLTATVAGNAAVNTSARQIRLNHRATSSNEMYIYADISTRGVVTWGVYTRENNIATRIIVGPDLGIAAGSGAFSMDMKLDRVGTRVTATARGVTATATISENLAGLLDTGNEVHMTSQGASTGAPFKVSDFTVEARALSAAMGQVVKIRNGSHPGAGIAYHTERLSKVIPGPADVLYVSLGHNQKKQGPDAFVAEYAAYVDAAQAITGGGVVAVSQNPEYEPYALAPHHAPRLAALRAHAISNGWSYLGVFERFWAEPDHGKSLVMSDGIHPLTAGSKLWASLASNQLDLNR